MTSNDRPNINMSLELNFEDLLRVFEIERATLVWNSLQSAYDRLLFARHHMCLLNRLAPNAVTQMLEATGYATEMKNGEVPDGQAASRSMHFAKMHVTDCVQHMHAVGDTIAYSIYFLLEVPPRQHIEKKYITQKAVKEILNRCPASVNANVFLQLLNKLADHSDHQYLRDLNNHAKHRSIVSPRVDLTPAFNGIEAVQRDLLIFPKVEMSYPPPELKNIGATPCHAHRAILPFIEAELQRTWSVYGDVRCEIKHQLNAAPSRIAQSAAHQS